MRSPTRLAAAPTPRRAPADPALPPGRLTRGARRRLRRAGMVAAVIPLGATVLASCDIPLATFTVDSLADGVDATIGDGVCATAGAVCTLRAAIQEGNANPAAGFVQVNLQAGIHVLSTSGASEDGAATGDLDLLRPFTLSGTGFPSIRQGSADRVLDVHPGASLDLVGLRVEQGDVAGDGAGIRAVIADVELTSSQVSNNLASGSGGGISVNGGMLTLTDASIVDNSAAGGAGGISASRAAITATTLSNNTGIGASASGILLTDTAGSSTVSRSTIADNKGGPAVLSGGALAITDTTVTDNQVAPAAIRGIGPVTVGNSVVITKNGAPGCAGNVTSVGNNLQNAAGCAFAGANDIQSTVPALHKSLPIGIHLTYLPIPFGPASDSGGACGASDQLGASRPIDADNDGLAECDRGAIEAPLAPLFLQVDSPLDGVDVDPGDGSCATATAVCSLRAAIQESNAWPAADKIVVGTAVSLSLAGPSENAGATGDLDITDSVLIQGSGEGVSLTNVDANDLDRVFDVRSGAAEVTIEGLHLLNGEAPVGEKGGALRVISGGIFSLRYSRVHLNVAHSGGGGIFVGGTTATLDSSTFDQNDGGSAGGAILVGAGPATTIVNSTVNANSATSGSAVSVAAGANVAIVDSTISTNQLGPGLASAGTLTARNSIFGVHPTGGVCSAPVTTLGHNMSTDTTCGFTGTADVQNANPILGALANNGGPTPTMKPSVISLAINSGECNSPTDQRDVNRPQGGACDKGSVEQA